MPVLPVDRLELVDLVRNGSISPAGAATLATAASELRSLLVVAIPQNAGKTTTMLATLRYAPAGTPVHFLSEEHGDTLGIPQESGGYLVLLEIAPRPPMYLWGEPVRRVFRALHQGFSLCTALHAADLESAFEVICGQNGVPDEDAARLDLMVYIDTCGTGEQTRRRISQIHEIETVQQGRPHTRLLHRWDETSDRFLAEETPSRIGRRGGDHARHLDEFERLG